MLQIMLTYTNSSLNNKITLAIQKPSTHMHQFWFACQNYFSTFGNKLKRCLAVLEGKEKFNEGLYIWLCKGVINHA
jgi:hypothetical protein